MRTTLPYPDPASTALRAAADRSPREALGYPEGSLCSPVAPTAPLPLTRTLAPTEPPDSDIVTTHQIPVFANAATPPAPAPAPRRDAGWFVRVALSAAIVVMLIASAIVYAAR